MNKQHYDQLIKLLLIGDSGVGKSSLLMRYDEDRFSTKFIQTLGIDYRVKLITLNNKIIKVQVWDTAGQERFRTITNAYYRGAMGIIIVYDVTDPISFDNVRNWMNSIEENATEFAVKILVGTKCDLSEKRLISTQRGQQLADEFGIRFYETSAKIGTNVEELFMETTKKVFETLIDVPKPEVVPNIVDPNKFVDDNNKGGNGSGCCN